MTQLLDFKPGDLAPIKPPSSGEATYTCPDWPGLVLKICQLGRYHWYYHPQDYGTLIYLGMGQLADVRRYYQECRRGVSPEDIQRTLKREFRRLFSEWRQDNDLPKGRALRLAKTALGELQTPR